MLTETKSKLEGQVAKLEEHLGTMRKQIKEAGQQLRDVEETAAGEQKQAVEE